MSKQKQKQFCTQYVLNLCFSGNSKNDLLSYCGLTDARMRASEKDLPVIGPAKSCNFKTFLVYEKVQEILELLTAQPVQTSANLRFCFS